MPAVRSRYRALIVCGVLIFIAVSLATINAKSPYRIDPAGVLFGEILSPLQAGATTLAQGTQRIWTRYRDMRGVYTTNTALRTRLATLDHLPRRLAELELENRRLERLLALRRQTPGTAIASRIIGRNSIPGISTAVLDKGERDGIRKGMAVLTPAGVAGRVVSVGPHVAHVLLISATTSGVDALVQRSRVPGIVSGTLTGNCRLKYVQRDSDVRVGDAIVTSGLGGIFPKGQHIGHVAHVAVRDDEMFQDVEVKLSAEFTRIEEVLVVARDDVPARAEPFPGS